MAESQIIKSQFSASSKVSSSKDREAGNTERQTWAMAGSWLLRPFKNPSCYATIAFIRNSLPQGCGLSGKGQMDSASHPRGRVCLALRQRPPKKQQNHGLLGWAEHQGLLLRDNLCSSPNTITRDLIQELQLPMRSLVWLMALGTTECKLTESFLMIKGIVLPAKPTNLENKGQGLLSS